MDAGSVALQQAHPIRLGKGGPRRGSGGIDGNLCGRCRLVRHAGSKLPCRVVRMWLPGCARWNLAKP
jgi:hypothetical protein